LESAFDLFDIDGDGVVKLRDLSAALARRGHSCSDAEVYEMMGLVMGPVRARFEAMELEEFKAYFSLLVGKGSVNVSTQEVFSSCIAHFSIGIRYEGLAWGSWHPELFEQDTLICSTWGVAALPIISLENPRVGNVWFRRGVSKDNPTGQACTHTKYLLEY